MAENNKYFLEYKIMVTGLLCQGENTKVKRNQF